MRVPFLDLRASYNVKKQEIDNAVMKSLDSGYYIGGNEVADFEIAYAKFTNSSFCIGVSNGLDALRLSLIALGIGPGDEVIVPTNTYIATWLAVSHVGATPVPVEPSMDTYNIDVQKIEGAITSHTKAIIPVHLYGLPCEIQEILQIAKTYSLYVLEDAAQCHGASINQQPIGCFGDLTAWSFYPGKNLGAFGDAGAVTTNNKELADKLMLLRNYGSSKKYVNNLLGFNCRLDPIQASILSVKLNYLVEWKQSRKKIADYYSKCLNESVYILPPQNNNPEHAWHLYVILSNQRQRLQDYLFSLGIQTLIHYPIPPYLQAPYRPYYDDKAYPISSKLSSTCLSLPLYPQMPDSQVEFVVESLNKFS